MRVVVCVALALAWTAGTSDAQELRVASYVTGLVQPVGLVADPSEPRRQLVIEKGGRIRVVDRGVLLPDAALDVSLSAATARPTVVAPYIPPIGSPAGVASGFWGVYGENGRTA